MTSAAAVGKRVRGALYTHISAVGRLPSADKTLVVTARKLAGDFAWNVVRLGPGQAVGLLDYPEFDEDAFPALARAMAIDIEALSLKRSDYRRSANPLILHRKELLVAADYPHRQRWADLTADMERLGLFRDLNRIGRRKTWLAMLQHAGRDTQGRPLP